MLLEEGSLFFRAGRTAPVALLWLRGGDGSAPRFRKNPTKNQKTTRTRRVRTRGKDTGCEKNIGRKKGEKGGREGERKRERKREAWAEENGGTRRERKRDSRGREFGVMKEKEGEKKGAAN